MWFSGSQKTKNLRLSRIIGGFHLGEMDELRNTFSLKIQELGEAGR